ncbi:MAG: PspA/IM30 family protein [Varibaculum sp.]|nr:PspA/IM30 family protein [Varibaculum sp.]
MTEKKTILGRITQLAKANINALLDRAEDPEKMLDQLIRDYTNSIAEAESAVAQTIGNLRLAEKDCEEDRAAAKSWGEKAKLASAEAEKARIAGSTEQAEKFDNLARVALSKQIEAENEVKAQEPMIASQQQVVDKLKTGLDTMKTKLEDLKGKRDSLVARAKTAEAQNQVQDAMASINILDPSSEIGRFEERVRREEAMAQGKAEIAADSLDEQFAQLGNAGADAEVEARLAALKNS